MKTLHDHSISTKLSTLIINSENYGESGYDLGLNLLTISHSLCILYPKTIRLLGKEKNRFKPIYLTMIKFSCVVAIRASCNKRKVPKSLPNFIEDGDWVGTFSHGGGPMWWRELVPGARACGLMRSNPPLPSPFTLNEPPFSIQSWTHLPT